MSNPILFTARRVMSVAAVGVLAAVTPFPAGR